MNRVNKLFEKYAKLLKLVLRKDGLGDYTDVHTENMYTMFALGYDQGERDATKPLHELEEPNE